jgi:hypothetical protein
MRIGEEGESRRGGMKSVGEEERRGEIMIGEEMRDENRGGRRE